ncbi:MAG: ABC transporter substrate-binding protein [Nitriliruptor sp.]|nr:MAG: ABC transporter substrate-binding protein [Nitriliruptor sp.]
MWKVSASVAAVALVLAACGAEGVDDDGDIDEPDLGADEDLDEDEDTDDTDDTADEATGDGEELLIGRISALEGPFAASAEDGERTVQMVLDEFGGEVAGRPIRTIVESSDTTPETAVDRARKLVEQDGVSIIHGPLSGGEGAALADYAKSVPHVTFVDAASGGTATTLDDPAENYFRWHSEGAMWTSPLGTFTVEELGYTNIATLGEDYAFAHSNVGGFMDSYCAAGGEVAETYWVPLGESDYSSVIASLPDDLDAIFVAVGGSDAVDFLTQAEEFGVDIPIIGGSILVTIDVLSSEGDVREAAIGTVSSGPIPPANAEIPDWQAFQDDYREANPDGFETPTLQAVLYYNSFKSLMLALEANDGVVEEDNGESLRQTMSELEWESPIGGLSLNENRQAATSIFIYEITDTGEEILNTELVQQVDGVQQGDTVWERLDGCP